MNHYSIVNEDVLSKQVNIHVNNSYRIKVTVAIGHTKDRKSPYFRFKVKKIYI